MSPLIIEYLETNSLLVERSAAQRVELGELERELPLACPAAYWNLQRRYDLAKLEIYFNRFFDLSEFCDVNLKYHRSLLARHKAVAFASDGGCSLFCFAKPTQPAAREAPVVFLGLDESRERAEVLRVASSLEAFLRQLLVVHEHLCVKPDEEIMNAVGDYLPEVRRTVYGLIKAADPASAGVESYWDYTEVAPDE